jgi:hypothetical protein
MNAPAGISTIPGGGASMADAGIPVSPDPSPTNAVALTTPFPSLFTIAFGVFPLVAAFAMLAPLATFAAVTPPTWLTTVAPCVPVTSPANAPVKFTALPAVVALVAFPTKAPVIVPTMKFPFPSRFTTAFAMFSLVAPLPSISNNGG